MSTSEYTLTSHPPSTARTRVTVTTISPRVPGEAGPPGRERQSRQVWSWRWKVWRRQWKQRGMTMRIFLQERKSSSVPGVESGSRQQLSMRVSSLHCSGMSRRASMQVWGGTGKRKEQRKMGLSQLPALQYISRGKGTAVSEPSFRSVGLMSKIVGREWACALIREAQGCWESTIRPQSYCIINLDQSIILVTDLPMSREHSIRKCLLEEESAPKKQVATDINAWMETQAKQKPHLLVRRRQPSQPLFPTQPAHHPTTQPHPPPMEDLQKAINRSRERLPLYEKKLECAGNYSRERLQEKKTDRASTHCSNNMVSLLLGSEESVGRTEPEVKVKPFNSGYVLHQLRRRGKQQRYLKQFSPQHQNDPMQGGAQSITCLRKRIDCSLKSGRLRTLPL